MPTNCSPPSPTTRSAPGSARRRHVRFARRLVIAAGLGTAMGAASAIVRWSGHEIPTDPLRQTMGAILVSGSSSPRPEGTNGRFRAWQPSDASFLGGLWTDGDALRDAGFASPCWRGAPDPSPGDAIDLSNRS